MITKKCDNCGNPYKIYPHRKNESRFCSQRCFHAWQSSFEFKERMKAYRSRVDLQCKQCGKIYWTHVGRKEESKFCSHKCYTNWLGTPEGKESLKEIRAANPWRPGKAQKEALAARNKERMKDPETKAKAVEAMVEWSKDNPNWIQRASEDEKFNCGVSKDWKVVKPSGKIIRVRNLKKWVGDNIHLFEDERPESKRSFESRVLRGLYASYVRGYYYYGWLVMAKKGSSKNKP